MEAKEIPPPWFSSLKRGRRKERKERKKKKVCEIDRRELERELSIHINGLLFKVAAVGGKLVEDPRNFPKAQV